MTQTPGTGMILAATLFFTVITPTAYSQDSPLKIEIKTTPTVVKNVQDFDIKTKIENIGNEDQILRLSQCSYSSLQWMADNSLVHVKRIACKKNSLNDVRLKPGQTYERALTVRIEVPVLDLPQRVTFRLGFSLRYEAILRGIRSVLPPHSVPVSPIWSNAVTITITE